MLRALWFRISEKGHHMVYLVGRGLAAVVEGQHRRQHHVPVLRRTQQVAAVRPVQRRLARHEHHLADLLGAHISGAHQQVY